MMFNVDDGGMVQPLEFKRENLAPDRSIIVMDEEKQRVWVWHGKLRGLVPRRMALRQAESLKGHGYQAGNAIVGRGLSEIVEIDDRKVGREPETTRLNEELMTFLGRRFGGIGNYVYVEGEGKGSSGGSSSKAATAAAAPAPTQKAAAPAPAQKAAAPKVELPKTEPHQAVHLTSVKSDAKADTKELDETKKKLKDAESKATAAESKATAAESKATAAESKATAAESKAKSLESKLKESEAKIKSSEAKAASAEQKAKDIEAKAVTAAVAAAPKSGTEYAGTALTDEGKAGAMIISVMSQFKDIWISKKDGNVIAIEQMDGKICAFTIENGEVKLQPDAFKEVPPEKTAAIEAKYKELTA